MALMRALVLSILLACLSPSAAFAEVAGPTERAAAARRLGEEGSAEAVAALRQALRQDPAVEVRVAAVRALGEIDSEEAHAAVVEARRDDASPEVREAAREALGEPLPRRRSFPAISFSGMMAVALGWGLPVAAGLLELLIGGAMGNDDAVESGWKVLIPLAGPPWAAMTAAEPDVTFITLGWVATAVQAMGIGLWVIGSVVEGSDALFRADASSPRLAMLPAGPTGAAGLTLLGSF